MSFYCPPPPPPQPIEKEGKKEREGRARQGGVGEAAQGWGTSVKAPISSEGGEGYEYKARGVCTSCAVCAAEKKKERVETERPD